jgi:hypothetical protein
MAIFNSYVKLPEGTNCEVEDAQQNISKTCPALQELRHCPQEIAFVTWTAIPPWCSF